MVALALVSTTAIPVPAAQAGIPKEPNGIDFRIRTSQGINAHILYVDKAKSGTVSVGVDVIMSCTGEMGPFTRRLDAVVEGRPKGNSFNGFYNSPLNFPGEFETSSANVSFRPGGRKDGFPRWRKATGAVRFSTASEAFGDRCDSGPISFVTTSSDLGRFIPSPF